MLPTLRSNRLIYFALPVFLLAGCASTQVSTRANTDESVYECVEGDEDSPWDCKEAEVQASPAVVATANPGIRRRVPEREAIPETETQVEPQPQRRGGIRLRGSSRASDTPTRPQTAEQPSSTRESTPAQVSQRTSASANNAEEAQPNQQRRRGGWLRLRGRGDNRTEDSSAEAATAARSERTTQTVSETQTRSGIPETDLDTPTTANTPRTSEPVAATTSTDRNQPITTIASTVSETMSGRVSSQLPTERVAMSNLARGSAPSPDLANLLQNGSNYVVQLAAFREQRRAIEFERRYPSINLSQLRINSNGTPFYVVIAGIFQTRGEAQIHSEVLLESYELQKPYIRTVASMDLLN